MSLRAARRGLLLALAAAGCAARSPAAALSPALSQRELPPHVEPDLLGATHVVKRGETLYRIARTYGVDQLHLMDVNGITDVRSLEVGMELFVPGARRPLQVPPAAAGAWGAPPGAAARPRAVVASAETGAVGAEDDGEREEPAGRDAIPETGPLRLEWPIRGVLFSRYGPRRGNRHDGIDIAAPEGTLVSAAAAGTVLFAGRQSGYGAIVILRHRDDLVTVYAHASALLVAEGDEVEQGTPIARVGQSGRTTGPHLHFEVRKGTRPRNPLLFLP